MISDLKIVHRLDPLNPFAATVTGVYSDSVTIDGNIRDFVCYIPQGVRSSTSAVFVLGDDHTTAEELYEKSNWKQLADEDERKEKFIVFYLESRNEGWNLEDPRADLDYIHEVYNKSRGRDKYCVHEAKYYFVGYKTGGTMAQMAAMDDPAEYAGVASVDAPDISNAFALANAESDCLLLNGYEDTKRQYGYKKKDFTVPSWIITSEAMQKTSEGETATYWKKAAGITEDFHMVRPDTMEFVRTEDAPWTVNQEKEAFRIWISRIEDGSADYGRKINRRIWADFLRDVRRWMAEPGGDLRMTHEPVLDLGMEYHYELIGGFMREYYVYVPTYLRKGFSDSVPLVFAMHGYSCSGEIYTGNSEWFKVAEDRGFIVVFPSACHGHIYVEKENHAVSNSDTELPAWNIYDAWEGAPDELLFFDSMIEKICARYAIDTERIYATGHSLGSLMTQLLGMARPKTFAAIAPCSGVLFLGAKEKFAEKESVKNREDVELPVWMFGGEHEEWLLDAVPTKENVTGDSVKCWWKLNHMEGDHPLDFEGYRQDQGRWKNYEFKKASVPMIRYTWVEEMPHATMTEMSYMIWDDFFSKFSRDKDGIIHYDELS
ncbi:MAG: PHB depolymerase family esterase [Eubacteriales bacterium]|nr:PHB depolymerase family esterase [Eubacteriales bacterium]